jgi:hypothetical protein
MGIEDRVMALAFDLVGALRGRETGEEGEVERVDW